MITAFRSVLCGQIIRLPTQQLFRNPQPITILRTDVPQELPQGMSYLTAEYDMMKQYEYRQQKQLSIAHQEFQLRSKRHNHAKLKRARRKDGKKIVLK